MASSTTSAPCSASISCPRPPAGSQIRSLSCCHRGLPTANVVRKKPSVTPFRSTDAVRASVSRSASKKKRGIVEDVQPPAAHEDVSEAEATSDPEALTVDGESQERQDVVAQRQQEQEPEQTV